MDERNENTQPAFTASTAEKRTALFMYIAAYIYTLTTGSRWQLWLAAFVVLFVMMAEYLYRNVPRSKESWVWLGCAVLVTACTAIGRSRAWGEFYSIAAVHILAVWWALSRGGKLIEGERASSAARRAQRLCTHSVREFFSAPALHRCVDKGREPRQKEQ